jgi:ABC-2 type transport system ATP-binding protein
MDIRIENLTKKYGYQKAVDNISFSVKTGEIVGFLGPNGAGKTTTMKIITNYLNCERGRCSSVANPLKPTLRPSKSISGTSPRATRCTTTCQ